MQAWLAPQTPVHAHRHLFTEDDWIAYAVRGHDGAWRFHGPDVEWKPADMLEVTLGRLLEMDATLAGLADLPPGWHAWRGGRDESWQRAPLED